MLAVQRHRGDRGQLERGTALSYLDRALPAIRADLNVSDERLWSGYGRTFQTATGLTVTADKAMQISCFFTGIRIISEMTASLPFDLFVEREDGGFDKKKNPFLRQFFRDRANPWQTPQQWRGVTTARALLYPETISEKKVGAGGLELWPIDPEHVTKTEQLGDGTLRWTLQEPQVASRTLVQDQVFRLTGFGTHNFMAADVLRLARETMGLWLAKERFGSLYFAQGAKGSVWIQLPDAKPLSDTAFKRLQQTTEERYSGFNSFHKAFVLEGGATVKETGNSAEQAQLVEFSESLVFECARWLNMPAHMLRAGAQPTFASIEQFASEFIYVTMMPWFRRWSEQVKFDLVTEEDVVARYNLDELLRGKMLERAQANAIYLQNGVFAGDEVRVTEGKNPLGTPEMKTPARSTNQGHPLDNGAPPKDVPAPSPPPAPKKKPKKVKPPEDAAAFSLRLRLLARSAAERILGKESARLQALATKHAADPARWEAAVAEFYAEHGSFVAETLHIPPALAREWAATQRDAVKVGGVAVVETWNPAAIDRLTSLALAA